MLSRTTATASYADCGGTALASGSPTYDATGNVLTSKDGRGTVTSFTYDPTGLVLCPTRWMRTGISTATRTR